jgi:hypothetical protein
MKKFYINGTLKEAKASYQGAHICPGRTPMSTQTFLPTCESFDSSHRGFCRFNCPNVAIAAPFKKPVEPASPTKVSADNGGAFNQSHGRNFEDTAYLGAGVAAAVVREGVGGEKMCRRIWWSS